MLTIFMDESGIHKPSGYSVFVLVLISIEDRVKVENKIIEAEKRRKIKLFHWAELPWKLRAAFVKDVAKLPFTARAAIIKNPIHPVQSLEQALLSLLIEKKFSALFIDGKKPRWVALKLKKALRDKGLSVKKIKTVQQSSSPCIRLADAFAGLIRAYFENPSGKAQLLWRRVHKKITTQLLGGQVTR